MNINVNMNIYTDMYIVCTYVNMYMVTDLYMDMNICM
jgi:hypothetical protein